MNSPLANGQFYHIFNRGVEKRLTFMEVSDYNRFLKTLSFYRFHPTQRKLSTHLKFNLPLDINRSSQKELLQIVCFCLMPNHFHLLVQQLTDNGISEFIRRVIDSYTRYFNTKNKRVGSLFQGKFKAKLVETDEYLLQLSKYIHRNPLSLPLWKNNLKEYSFSSYPGYLDPRRNLEFCSPDIIGTYFKNNSRLSSYVNFIEGSDAIQISNDLLIDEDFA